MKEKRRSNETRKAKSRDAARCRRSRETDIFTELAAVLPVDQIEAAHLDKASVMRLAIAYLKTRTLMDAVPKPLAKPEISPDMDELFLKALDGFVMVLDNNGDVAYVSTNVQDYLGIPQMDLMGQSVFDYSHPCDHDEIRESLSIKASEIREDHPCNFFLRLKCTLTSKGRKVNLKSASYKVIHCSGRIIAHLNNPVSSKNDSDSENQEEIVEREPGISLVVVASPVPHPSNIEIPLGKYTFLSKHSLNMKFTYADENLEKFLGWKSKDLVGESVFEFQHALDNLSLDKSFKSLFHKGQAETLAYRFLNKSGGYAWVVTQATLIYCNKINKPLSVVCVNYLLSGVEHEDEVYSVRQLEASAPRVSTTANNNNNDLPALQPAAVSRKPLSDKPVSVTSSLFRQSDNLNKPQLAVKATPRLPCNKENDKFIQEVKVETKIPVVEVEPKQNYQEHPLSFVPLTTLPEPPAYQAPRNESQPQAATASIFAPRTKDMNKGFLTFCEDQPGLTMLKDEPEDLTHLAPVAGDVCVPLEDPPFLSDMLDEFILNSNYCPELLSPELTGAAEPTELSDSGCSQNVRSQNNNNLIDQTILNDPLRSDDCNSSDGGDPFIYRDSPSRCSLGTDLHSPTLTKSPEGSGICDSLSSPNGSGGGLSSEDEMLMLSISDVMVDDDVMTLRAPFIPMSDQDEALQLLISDDMVMWGPNSDKKSKWMTDVDEENANSSLAQLLANEPSLKKIKMDNGNTLVNPAQVLGQISLKNTTKDITADRSNKRVHAFSNKTSNNSKRFKQNNYEVVNNDVNSVNFDNILSNSVQKSQLLQQLVSQQIPKSRNWSDQSESKNRMINGNANAKNGQSTTNLFKNSSLCRLADDGGGAVNNMRKTILDDGGGRVPQQQQQQQSNSVLMNLLVSGCDNQGFENQVQNPPLVFATRNIIGQQPQQQQQQQQQQQVNISPIQVGIEEQLQTVPQWNNNNQLYNCNQYVQNKQELSPLPVNSEAMTYENDFDFMDTGNIFPDSNELLHVFETNLA